MKISCGIILVDNRDLMLGCLPFFKADEKGNYDIPKGQLEKGETPHDRARREFKEETGLDIGKFIGRGIMSDLGEMAYISGKNLHLFKVHTCNLPKIEELHCDSMFEYSGKEYPEIFKYRHIPISELDWFFPKLASCIKSSTNL